MALGVGFVYPLRSKVFNSRSGVERVKIMTIPGKQIYRVSIGPESASLRNAGDGEVGIRTSHPRVSFKLPVSQLLSLRP
jgi:hypothetical protein